MSILSEKYASVVAAAQQAGIAGLQVTEQDGTLYIKGTAGNDAAKDQVWDALGKIDPNYSASDINIDVQTVAAEAGSTLYVETEETSLNIRQEPSTEGTIIGKAEKGSRVTLVERSSDDWYKIRTSEGVEGYAYARYLKA